MVDVKSIKYLQMDQILANISTNISVQKARRFNRQFYL